MVNIFGSTYEELGSTSKNLLLNTLGKIKVKFGNKYVDLLDENGEIKGLRELEKRISKLEKSIN